jgi:hypothetical protein
MQLDGRLHTPTDLPQRFRLVGLWTEGYCAVLRSGSGAGDVKKNPISAGERTLILGQQMLALVTVSYDFPCSRFLRFILRSMINGLPCHGRRQDQHIRMENP